MSDFDAIDRLLLRLVCFCFAPMLVSVCLYLIGLQSRRITALDALTAALDARTTALEARCAKEPTP